MIERYVFVKLTPEHATPEGRAVVAAETRRVLPKVPGVREVRVGVPADEAARASWDLSIAVRFDRIDDVEPYIHDVTHRAYVDEFLSPRSVVKKAWNFDLG